MFGRAFGCTVVVILALVGAGSFYLNSDLSAGKFKSKGLSAEHVVRNTKIIDDTPIDGQDGSEKLASSASGLSYGEESRKPRPSSPPTERSTPLEDLIRIDERSGEVSVWWNTSFRFVTKLVRNEESGENSTPWVLKIPERFTRIIVEVGTNKEPDYLADVKKRNDTFYVMVEPVETIAASEMCQELGEKCVLFPAALHNRQKRATFHIGKHSKCSSLLGDGRGLCATVRSTLSVSLLTLDTILKLIPKRLNISLLSLDCQGTDLMVAGSMPTQRHRVGNMILECQDLPLGGTLSPGANNCGQMMSCLWNWTKVGWRMSVCMPNQARREFNCVWHNSRNPTVDYSVRPKFLRPARKKHFRFPTECPPEFFL